jgi:hypothetical protein
MCACGCFLVLLLGAAMVYCVMHSLWIGVVGVVAVGALVGWLGAKAMKKTNASGPN